MSGGYTVCIGDSSVDIIGLTDQPVRLGDKNPTFRLSAHTGGAARNMAENLCRLGGRAKLLTCVGDDLYAQQILRDSTAAGIDCTAVRQVPDHPSSSCILLNGPSGDTCVAVGDLRICQYLTGDYLAQHRALLAEAEAVMMCMSLQPDALDYLFDEFPQVPKVVDVSATEHAALARRYLARIDTLKVNEFEAAALVGQDDPKHCPEQMLEALLQMGPTRVFLTMGPDGAMAGDRSGGRVRRPALPLKPVNTTGAGDCFTAATQYCRTQGYDLAQTVDFCQAAAAITMTCEACIAPDLTDQKVLRWVQRYQKGGTHSG